ncbi:MAG: rod shape-determining protein MreD [Clostridia bacterium]
MRKCILIFFVTIIVVFIDLFYISNNVLLGIKPNLILILVILLTSIFKNKIVHIYAFCLGLILDLIYGTNVFMFAYPITSICVSTISKSYNMDNKLAVILNTITGVSIFELFLFIFLGNTINVFYLLKISILSIILNVVISYVIYFVINKIYNMFDVKLGDIR